MGKIHTLSSDIIAKIAAGEVIERPSYAVKELLENAIDAHASMIEVVIEDSGLKTISVIDNGEGMDKSDLELCFQPHTTSKISPNDELMGITSLGFRGEALSSLASIAYVTIISRTKNDIGGTQVTLKRGLLEEISPIAAPYGTTVTIAHLFHDLPARKKFLKSSQTEFRHITDVVMSYALSHPEIHFILRHNKKIIFDLPMKNDENERIELNYGKSLFDLLIPIDHEEGYVKLKGYIGKPQASSKLNQKQYLYVNNRLVTDHVISLAIREAYGTLLPATSTPIFILNISVPPETVDVNVHPRKEQIAFVDSKNIFEVVKNAVQQILTDNNLTFRLAKFKNENSAKMGETTTFAGITLRKNTLHQGTQSTGTKQKNTTISQIDNTYLFIQHEDSVSIVDQHAAHERVLFEMFSSSFSTLKNNLELYHLPRPLSLQFALQDVQLLTEYEEEFTKVGFFFEHFQGTTFILRSIPLIFKGRNIEKIVRDMTDTLSLTGTTKTIDTNTHRLITFLSCRAAVKAGDILTQGQMKKIISDLKSSKNNATCPHGRPTTIQIGYDELHVAFKRK
jgi:DNA mismatch repair protein MutL